MRTAKELYKQSSDLPQFKDFVALKLLST